MTVHDAIAAVPEAGTPDRALLQGLLIARHIHVFFDSDDPTQFNPVSVLGKRPIGVAFQGRLFWHDPADNTTAHDGVTTLVLGDASRYKVTDTIIASDKVLDRDLTAPPGGETFGDAYIAAAASTGAWAGNDDDIAIFTARGWVFVTPGIGKLVYVVDETKHYKFTASGWVLALVAETGSIGPTELLGGKLLWNVVNQSENNPPASVEQGVSYIIGPAPTGAWTGQSLKIGYRAASGTGAVDTIITPQVGWLAFDVDTENLLRWTGLLWQIALGNMRGFNSVITDGLANTSLIGTNSYYEFSAGSPPTTLHRRHEDNKTINFTASAGTKLRFRYTALAAVGAGAAGDTGTAGQQTVAIFRDDDVIAIEHAAATAEVNRVISGNIYIDRSFILTAADGNPHTYKIAVTSVLQNNLRYDVSFDLRRFTVEELVESI